MKNLFLITLLFPFFVNSQITLSVADFSDGGDTVRMSNSTDLSIDFSSTGPNYSWDYSSLVPNSQTLYDYQSTSSLSFLAQVVFGTFAAPDYQATNYISSTALPLDQIGGFLPVNITDVYQFSKNSSDSITSIGMAVSIDGNEVPFKSDTIETRYKLPLNYNDTYSSRGYTNLDMNPIYNGVWIQYKQRSSVVDGWGNIITPYGSFDVLRIDHAITETDSLFVDVFGGFWVELPIPDSHVYEWWANNEKEPILRITTNDILGNETVTSVEYRDIYRGLEAGIDDLRLEFSIFPNPAENYIQIHGAQINAQYKVISSEGKNLLSGTIASPEDKISIIELPAGIYTLMVLQNDVVGKESFVKK